jgi:hypothetical protein
MYLNGYCSDDHHDNKDVAGGNDDNDDDNDDADLDNDDNYDHNDVGDVEDVEDVEDADEADYGNDENFMIDGSDDGSKNDDDYIVSVSLGTGCQADDSGVKNDSSRIIDLVFPRLRYLRVYVRYYYSAACDRAIADFLRRRCPSARLANVEVRLICTSQSYVAVSPRLFAHLAGRASLKELGFHWLEVPHDALEVHEAAETAATATVALPDSVTARQPYFAGLQRFATDIAPGAMAALAPFLPDTLTALHLQFSDRRSSRRSSRNADDASSDTATAVAGSTISPLSHLFGNGARGQPNAAASATTTTCAPRFPSLRQLELRYERGPESAAEFDVLRSLPQLEVLEIGGWDGDNSWDRCSSCDGFDDDDALEADDFTDANLARLVAGLPRLRRLGLAILADLSDDALRMVGRACRQLEHLELRGKYDLYGVCRAAQEEGDECGQRCPLFPNLQSLWITGISRLFGPDESDEHHEPGELDQLDAPDELAKPANELEEAEEQQRVTERERACM